MNYLKDNILGCLPAISAAGRRIGKTTAICKAAKEIGATVVCANQQNAKFLASEHGIKTVTIHQSLRGTTGPYLYDHYAMELAFREMDNYYIKELQKVNKELQDTKILSNLVEFGYENLLIKYNELELKLKKRKKSRKKRGSKNL